MNFPHVSQSLGIVHPVCIERGKNAEVWDEDGHQYIDFIGGIGVLNLGHGHPDIVNAVKAQVDTLMHSAFNAVPHRGYAAVTESLNSFVPVSYPLICMLTNSGAEATENSLKVARAKTGRQAVIAFDNGFHGRTLAALNLNGKVKPYKTHIGSLPGPVYHSPFPSRDNNVSCDEALTFLNRILEVEIPADEVAAIIIEPVQGEGGFQLMDKDFALHLREICSQHGIVLIFDEIQSGFGRTGHSFAFTYLDIEPDLILMGKSMAAGLPLAAVAGKKEIMNSLPTGGLGGTYSGNAVACAASQAVMSLLSDENLRLWGEQQETAILAAYHKWKTSERFPMLGQLTGVGAMRGIIFEDTKNATGTEHLSALLKAGREQGVLLMPCGRKRNVLRLLPPLTIEPHVLERGLAKLGQALEALHA